MKRIPFIRFFDEGDSFVKYMDSEGFINQYLMILIFEEVSKG